MTSYLMTSSPCEICKLAECITLPMYNVQKYGFWMIWSLISRPNCPKFKLVVYDVIIDDVITVGNMQIRCWHHLMARYVRKIAVFAHYLDGADNYGQTDTLITVKLFLHKILYLFQRFAKFWIDTILTEKVEAYRFENFESRFRGLSRPKSKK